MSRRNFSVGISQRVEKYSPEMPQSPTSSQMKTFRWYFTESWKIFTANAIITDIYTDGYMSSAFHRKNIYFICHYHRQNISIGIFPAGIFLPTECGISDERYADRRFPSGI